MNGDLRIKGNSSGLLQVYYNGWGFICDNGWDTVDANTTCRILGYDTVTMTSIAKYNASTNYKLFDIRCTGGENSILDCGYRTYSSSSLCSAYEHVYIECGPGRYNINTIDFSINEGTSLKSNGLIRRIALRLLAPLGWRTLCAHMSRSPDASTNSKIMAIYLI